MHAHIVTSSPYCSSDNQSSDNLSSQYQPRNTLCGIFVVFCWLCNADMPESSPGCGLKYTVHCRGALWVWDGRLGQ